MKKSGGETKQGVVSDREIVSNEIKGSSDKYWRLIKNMRTEALIEK
jgi:hypothetical protein